MEMGWDGRLRGSVGKRLGDQSLSQDACPQHMELGRGLCRQVAVGLKSKSGETGVKS